jgi:diaminohydroxyphosphoribosylaminopyrimidine deaminase/5-amino-6-(5-phosphoribosylamino)uracil reductase
MTARTDADWMRVALGLARRGLGRVWPNPAVGCVLVAGGRVVGRGWTQPGGRPHAEAMALAAAGPRARGATAYVTLEPCAHHGRTPPCANALVTAGVSRIVGAATDPDERVSGKGYAILRQAGVEVVERVLAEEAADAMAGYLTRSLEKRPEVTLKLALSQDGMIGKPGEGQVAITGEVSRRQVHMLRAVSDAIVVGIGTAIEDDPELTVRLPGLANRSPARIVLDRSARLPVTSKLVLTAREVPLLVATCADANPARRAELERAGAGFLATETFDGRVALPELLEDLAAKGMSSVLVEGGAATAKYFLSEGLVDRIVLFRGAVVIGEGGLAAPIDEDHMPAGFRLLREATYGDDRVAEWARPI